MTQELRNLIDCVKQAIDSGDWTVDGTCDPTLLIVQAEVAILKENTLTLLVRSFFNDYLNIREESDSGHIFAPIAVSCSRALKLEPLSDLLIRMRDLSGAELAYENKLPSKAELLKARAIVIGELCNNGPYCCYCLDPQGDKISCCQENHFVPFEDLYPEDQEYMILNHDS